MPIRLLIAEDHDLLREGLRISFENTDIDVIGEATTAVEAVRLASLGEADVMLLDIKTRVGDRLDVLRRVKSANAELAVVIYSQHERWDFEDRARAIGAAICLPQLASAEELIDAVRAASRRASRLTASEGNSGTVPKRE